MLYVVPINGEMLYFLSEEKINESLYTNIEYLLKEIEIDVDDVDYMKFSEDFIKLSKERFNITLIHLKIKQVFRRTSRC